MKLLGLIICLVSAIRCQSPFANTMDASKAIRQFTNAFLNDLELTSSSNFVFSPFSIHSVFTQLLYGAQGETRTQLSRVLGLADTESTRASYRQLAASLGSGSAQLFTANELALAKGFKPKASYTRSLGAGYNVKEYDFVSDKVNSVREINNNILQNTGGHIRDLLLEDDVDQLTQLILINAIYFKAQWKTAFDPQDTQVGVFNSPVSGNVNTSFMTVEAKVRLLEDRDNGLDILELPYADETMGMVIVLPRAEANTAISPSLVNVEIADIRNKSPVDVTVTIPKFNMKYQTYLKEKMTGLGVTDLFSARSDLRGISDLPLYVDNGIHQASIEVNEEGSEAAAATAVVVGVRTIMRKKKFIADRPFLFMIYDFQNNMTLFAGKVVDPTNPIVIQEAPARLGNTVPDTVPSDRTQQPAAPASPDTEVCPRLVRDFPNALDNHKICNKVKEAGQFLDWLRDNRNLCEQSGDHYSEFMQHSCGAVFCDDAEQLRAAWQRDYTANCQGGTTPDNQQDCKNVENKLKAYKQLKC